MSAAPENNNDLRAFSLAQVSDRVSLSTRTLTRLIATGEIRAFRIGKRLRIPASELERLLAGDARKAG